MGHDSVVNETKKSPILALHAVENLRNEVLRASKCQPKMSFQGCAARTRSWIHAKVV